MSQNVAGTLLGLRPAHGQIVAGDGSGVGIALSPHKHNMHKACHPMAVDGLRKSASGLVLLQNLSFANERLWAGRFLAMARWSTLAWAGVWDWQWEKHLYIVDRLSDLLRRGVAAYFST